jgi:plastocyanin
MRILSVLILTGLTLAIAATAIGETRGVAVKDNSFGPKARSAAPGDVIRFNWNGVNPHDVKWTKAPRRAKPKNCALKTSGSCRRKVKKAGVYKYVCTVHLASDNMRGRIVVD